MGRIYRRGDSLALKQKIFLIKTCMTGRDFDDHFLSCDAMLPGMFGRKKKQIVKRFRRLTDNGVSTIWRNSYGGQD